MSQESLTTEIDRHGDQFPPSRPGPKTIIGAAIMILIGIAIMFCPDISSYIHFAQVKSALGLT